jgi:hypothetical protein
VITVAEIDLPFNHQQCHFNHRSSMHGFVMLVCSIHSNRSVLHYFECAVFISSQTWPIAVGVTSQT